MKRHWIHNGELGVERVYGDHDLSDLTTDCGKPIPKDRQPVRSGVQNCQDCTKAVIDKALSGVLYCGSARAVVF